MSELDSPTPEVSPLPPRRTSYSFGPFTFDARAGLRHGDWGINLGPRELWLLERLLEGRGDVVTFDALKGGLFDELFVTHTATHRAVQALRRALDDRLRKVIVSVHEVGYRIGPPVVVTDEPARGSEVWQSSAPARNARGEGARAAEQGTADDPSSFWERPSEASLSGAAAALREDMMTTPANPAACAAYADNLISQMIRGYIRPVDYSEEAFGAVERALAANPELPAALAARGWLCGTLHDDRYHGLKLIKQAQVLDPASERISFLKVWLLLGDKRVEEAGAELERAIKRRPDDHGLLWLKAWLLCVNRKYHAVRAIFDRRVRSVVENDLLWICDAIARVRMGARQSAMSSILMATKLSPRDWLVRANLAWVRAATGQRIGSSELLSRLPPASGAYSSPVMTAAIYHAIGERGTAAEFLRIARADRDPWALLAWCDPRLHGGEVSGV
jgi:DNA-binding winged helix-turn-helix (wHTH) protein